MTPPLEQLSLYCSFDSTNSHNARCSLFLFHFIFLSEKLKSYNYRQTDILNRFLCDFLFIVTNNVTFLFLEKCLLFFVVLQQRQCSLHKPSLTRLTQRAQLQHSNISKQQLQQANKQASIVVGCCRSPPPRHNNRKPIVMLRGEFSCVKCIIILSMITNVERRTG